MTLFMGDTASTNPAPPAYELAAVAGYVAGYVTYPTLAERWGATHHVLSITPNIDNVADCLDVENGDAVPAQAGPWVRDMLSRGVHRPCVYANGSTMPYVRESLEKAGLAREDYRLWVAAWDDVHDVPDGYDAHQFYGTLHGSWDYSVIAEDFFSTPAPPKPKPALSLHYDRYRANGERTAAERYDHWRAIVHVRKLKPRELTAYLARRVQCHLYMRRIELAVIFWSRHGIKSPWNNKCRRFRHAQLKIRAAGKICRPTA